MIKANILYLIEELMSPYLFMLIPLSLLLAFACSLDVHRQKAISYFCLFALTLFAGLRGFVGIDTYMYHTIYATSHAEGLGTILLTVEPVFALLVKMVHLVGGSSFLFVGLIAVFQGCLAILLIRSSNRPAAFLLLYLATYYLSFEFNILRAGTAIMFLVLATRFIDLHDQRYLYLCLLMAVLCHYSAIVGVLPLLYFTSRSKVLRICSLAMILVSFIALYIVFLNAAAAPEKYVAYAMLDLHAEIKPNLVALGFRIAINIALYLTARGGRKSGLMAALLISWVILRLISVEFVLVDRFEIIFNAIFIFLALENMSRGRSQKVQQLAFGCLVFLSLVSNLKGLNQTEEQLTRGQTSLDFSHSMSPYVPYKFIWDEKGL